MRVFGVLRLGGGGRRGPRLILSLLGWGMVVVVLLIWFFGLICWRPAIALTGASWISCSSSSFQCLYAISGL